MNVSRHHIYTKWNATVFAKYEPHEIVGRLSETFVRLGRLYHRRSLLHNSCMRIDIENILDVGNQGRTPDYDPILFCWAERFTADGDSFGQCPLIGHEQYRGLCKSHFERIYGS
jgi:hypothetical protein